jgi:hypothetical protein
MFFCLQKAIKLLFRSFFVGLFIITIGAHWQWFFSMGALTHDDWGWLLPETMRSFSLYPSLWSDTGFGGVDISLSMRPIAQILVALLSSFADFFLIERLIWFWPSVLVAVISMNLLAHQILRCPMGAGVATVAFIFSTYMIIGRTGHLTLMAAFSFIPLLLFLFIRALNHSLFYAIGAGLIGGLIGWYEARVLYMAIWLLFFYFLFNLFIMRGQGLKNNSLTVGFAAITVTVILLANAFWILPIALVENLSTNELFSRGLFGNNFMNIRQSLANFHPFWTGTRAAVFVVQPIGWQFFLLPALAFFGFMFYVKKNITIVFFALISLLGIFLSKQVGEPFGQVYPFLYSNLPGFGAFREASKFYFLIALGYAVLIGAFATWLWEKRHLSKMWRRVAEFGMLGLCILMLWNARPLITGEIGTLFVPKQMPAGYERVNRYLSDDKSFYRTLWVPNVSRWGLWTTWQPRLSADEMDDFLQTQKLLPKENIVMGESFQSFFRSPLADRILDFTGVKYVVVPCYDPHNEPEFGINYKTRAYYLNQISASHYLQRVDLGVSCPDVFINKNNTERINLVQPELAKDYQSNFLPYQSSKLVYQRLEAYLYKVRIENLTQPAYLRLLDTYNPGWKISTNEFSWLNVLLGTQNVLPDAVHTTNELGFNDFKLNPIELKNANLGRVNSEGGVDLDMTLFFAPQAHVWLGSFISINVVLVSFIYIFLSSVYFVSRKIAKRYSRSLCSPSTK